MKNNNIMTLSFYRYKVRVVIDREEPWVSVDDIVSVTAIEDKQAAIEYATKHANNSGKVRFDKIIILDKDNKETLIDITNLDGAYALADDSYHFRTYGPEDEVEAGLTLCDEFMQLQSNVFADWLVNSASELVKVHWNLLKNDYQLKNELKEKDREIKRLNEKLQEIALMAQSPSVDAPELAST